MKKLIAVSLLAALSESKQLWTSGNINLPFSSVLTVTVNTNLDYSTTYRAGEGPYYDKDKNGNPIYNALTSNEHYEEYGFEGHLYAYYQFQLTAGTSW